MDAGQTVWPSPAPRHDHVRRMHAPPQYWPLLPIPTPKGATRVPRDLWQKFLRALKAKGGDQKAKLFQFLNKIGARALRIQLGRVLEMAESSPDRQTYE